MKALRWSDNDKYFGPFTYAPSDYDRWAIMLGSGDDEYPHCRIRISAFKRTLICRLPQWILQPHKVKVPCPSWDAATVERLGRNWYWDVHEREYGFSYSDKALHVHYGAQTHCWPGSKSKVFFIPWLNWRHVRTSHYDTNGDLFFTEPKIKRFLGDKQWRENQDKIEACPTVSFFFTDYDGKQITAKTKIMEMEWRFGEGKFKWLSWFRKPMIKRSLDLRFSEEVGPEKGSWKGGTIGHSIEMLEGELHEQAFKRYCEKEHRSKYRNYKITYGGLAA